MKLLAAALEWARWELRELQCALLDHNTAWRWNHALWRPERYCRRCKLPVKERHG